MGYHISDCNVIAGKGKEKVVMKNRPDQIVLYGCHYDRAQQQCLQTELKKHDIELLVCENGDENLPKEKTGILVICEEKAEAERLKEAGYFVIISLYEKNEWDDFSNFSYAIMDACQVEAEFYIKVWQRFMNIPWNILETERCIIREMCEADLDALYEIYADESVSRYTENLFEDREKEKQYITDYRKNIYAYYGFGIWVVVRKSDGKLIGRAGYHYRPGFDYPELGFVFGVPYQKQGYAWEVCKSLMGICKDVYDFEGVQALTEPENEASVRLLDKLGFIQMEELILEEKKYFYYVNKEL